MLLASDIPVPQIILALTLAGSTLVVVIELVRRRKLREEYAWLWISTAVVLMVLALNTKIIAWLANLVQAESPLSILYFCALAFLMLVSLQFSVRLTKLSFRNKILAQQLALLEKEMRDLRDELHPTELKPTEIPRPTPTATPTTPTADSSKADHTSIKAHE